MSRLLSFILALGDLVPLWGVISYHQALGHVHTYTDPKVIGVYGIVGFLFIGTFFLFSTYSLKEGESFIQIAIRVGGLGLILFAMLPLFFRLADLSFSAKVVVFVGAATPIYLVVMRWVAFCWIWIPSSKLNIWWIKETKWLKSEIQTNKLFIGHHRLSKASGLEEVNLEELES